MALPRQSGNDLFAPETRELTVRLSFADRTVIEMYLPITGVYAARAAHIRRLLEEADSSTCASATDDAADERRLS